MLVLKCEVGRKIFFNWGIKTPLSEANMPYFKHLFKPLNTMITFISQTMLKQKDHLPISKMKNLAWKIKEELKIGFV